MRPSSSRSAQAMALETSLSAPNFPAAAPSRSARRDIEGADGPETRRAPIAQILTAIGTLGAGVALLGASWISGANRRAARPPAAPAPMGALPPAAGPAAGLAEGAPAAAVTLAAGSTAFGHLLCPDFAGDLEGTTWLADGGGETVPAGYALGTVDLAHGLLAPMFAGQPSPDDIALPVDPDDVLADRLVAMQEVVRHDPQRMASAVSGGQGPGGVFTAWLPTQTPPEQITLQAAVLYRLDIDPRGCLQALTPAGLTPTNVPGTYAALWPNIFLRALIQRHSGEDLFGTVPVANELRYVGGGLPEVHSLASGPWTAANESALAGFLAARLSRPTLAQPWPSYTYASPAAQNPAAALRAAGFAVTLSNATVAAVPGRWVSVQGFGADFVLDTDTPYALVASNATSVSLTSGLAAGWAPSPHTQQSPIDVPLGVFAVLMQAMASLPPSPGRCNVTA